MIAGVADTHAAVWFFSGDSRLSAAAKEFFFKAAAARRKIALSSISLAEVVYLIEKNRLPASAYDDLKQALANPNHVLEEAPFNAEVVEAMRQVPRVDVPDMPDRIVAATGLYFSVPVISRDGRIRASNIQTVW
jgi:PIN domain nuclease of toxin-antitoxin system